MFIVKNRKFFYFISGLVVVLSIAALLTWGLKFGIDFTGGSLLEVAYTGSAPTPQEITQALATAGIHGSSVRPTGLPADLPAEADAQAEGSPARQSLGAGGAQVGETGYLIRTPFLPPALYDAVKKSLSADGKWQYEEKQFNSIGPTIGSELQNKAIYAILLVLVAIALFIMFAFRKVSKPVSSWKYGLIALIALAHDVIVPVGVFAILGHFLGAEVDTLFVTAILVVLGFSVHDTIVVFDRVRENLHKNHERNMKEPFEETVGKSIAQTLNRSINTSLTVVLVLLALLYLGPASAYYFVLALLVGIVSGTYSSIFLGSPLLVTLEKMQAKK